MQVNNRFVIMLRSDLDSPRYEGQWPVIFIRDRRDQARALCGSTYFHVNLALSKGRYRATRVEPCSLVHAHGAKRCPGGIYRLQNR